MIFRLGAIRRDFRYGKAGLLLIDITILLGFLLSVSCLLLAAYILSVAYCSDFWVVLAFSFITICMTYVLYRRLREPVYTKFVEASRIIETESSRAGTLLFPGVIGWSGTLLELIDESSRKSTSRFISLGLPRTIKTPEADLEVRYWRDESKSSSTVVVEVSNKKFVGAVRNQPDIQVEFRRMRQLLTYLLWLGCLSALAAMIYMTFAISRFNQDIERALNSHDFPTVEAHIVSSQVGETRVSRGKARVWAWYPSIEYVFALAEEHRTGNRFSTASEIYFDKTLVEEIVLKYPPGSIHQLYYDPHDLHFTVLEPGRQEPLISERRGFLTKWTAIQIAIIALSFVFWLGKRKLLPEILAVQGKLRDRSRRKGSTLGLTRRRKTRC